MHSSIFLLVFLVNAAFAIPIIRLQRQATSTTTAAPSDTEIEEFDTEIDDPLDQACSSTQTDTDLLTCRGNYLAELLPENISRDRMKLVLQRALNLLEKPEQSVKQVCRGPKHDQEARNLIRALSGEPDFNFHHYEAHQTPVKSRDDDYNEQE